MKAEPRSLELLLDAARSPQFQLPQSDYLVLFEYLLQQSVPGTVTPGPTILAVLTSPAHPGTLRELKSWAKSNNASLIPDLPPPIASALYYASIASARLHGIHEFTRLDQTDFLHGVHWALSQPWLPPSVQSIFRQALELG